MTPVRNPLSIAADLAALDAWRTAAPHNWALIARGEPEPFFATVVVDQPAPVRARLLLLRGWKTFNNFVIARHDPSFGVAMSPMELDHFELVELADRSVKLFVHRPGYVPVPPDAAESGLLGRLLYECYGLLMRFEEDETLALRYAGERAMFARREGEDGKWADVPLPLPERPPVFMEQVPLAKDLLARAGGLPFDGAAALELDLFLIPGYRTNEPRPRLLYLFAGVDATTGQRIVWEKLSVSGAPDGLLSLWEHLAGRLLAAFLALGRVPGTVNVRSNRMVRFIRPLGLNLPFKLVTHAKLPALDAVVGQAVKEKNL